MLIRTVATRSAVVLGVTAAQVRLARMAPANASAAIGPVVLFAAATAVVVAPWLPLVMVLPATFLYPRVGPPALNISLAEAVQLVAVAAAIRFVPWRSRPLRRVLWAMAAYQGVILIALVAVPSQRAGLEWLHRISLVGGAVVVGSAIAACGLTAKALRCYLLAASIVAVAAFLDTIGNGLQPGYPFGIQKNSAGILIMVTVLLTFVAPGAIGLGTSMLVPVRMVLLIGLLSTQARGAMVSLIAVMVVWSVRSARFARTGPIVGLGVLAMIAAVALTTQRELSNPEAVRFSGINQRLTTNGEALAIWAEHRMTGAGLRYFRDPGFGTIQPENVAVAALAETGAVGLAGVTMLLALVWGAIRRLPGDMGSAARLLIGAKTIESFFGIFWVAGGGSIMWLVVGLAIGTDHWMTRAHPEAPLEDALSA